MRAGQVLGGYRRHRYPQRDHCIIGIKPILLGYARLKRTITGKMNMSEHSLSTWRTHLLYNEERSYILLTNL